MREVNNGISVKGIEARALFLRLEMDSKECEGAGERDERGNSLGHGARPHDPGSTDDVVHGDVATVLDVLHLLPVPGRLLQRLDHQGRRRGNNRHLVK